MPERIFREWLEDQMWNHCRRCRRIDVKLDLESIGKTHLLNTQIELNEDEFFSQFNYLPVGILERCDAKDR